MSIIIIVIGVLVIGLLYFQLQLNQIEYFVPDRYIAPNLYPSTGPVDMVGMKKFLIFDGYRFQNSMFPPVPINSEMGLSQSNLYPDSYRQRTGVFKEKAFVEKFTSGNGSGSGDDSRNFERETGGCPCKSSPFPKVPITNFEKASIETFADSSGGSGSLGVSASMGTIAQLNTHGGQDVYLLTREGQPLEQGGKYSSFARPNRRAEINYENGIFSWGDVIHRFYNPSHYQYSQGISI